MTLLAKYAAKCSSGRFGLRKKKKPPKIIKPTTNKTPAGMILWNSTLSDSTQKPPVKKHIKHHFQFIMVDLKMSQASYTA
jgi:hypothetical protein